MYCMIPYKTFFYLQHITLYCNNKYNKIISKKIQSISHQMICYNVLYFHYNTIAFLPKAHLLVRKLNELNAR